MTVVSEAAELWAATRVVEMHAPGGFCGQCEPDGSCRLLGWADARLRRWNLTMVAATCRPIWRRGGTGSVIYCCERPSVGTVPGDGV